MSWVNKWYARVYEFKLVIFMKLLLQIFYAIHYYLKMWKFLKLPKYKHEKLIGLCFHIQNW